MKLVARTVLGVAFAVSWGWLPAQQIDAAEMRLDISAQPRESALKQFSEQSGLQLLFSSEETAMREAAPAVIGLHTAGQALDHLLAGTDLKYEYVNARTVAIREKHVTSRDGFVVFDDAELRDVVDEFNRYTARKIVISDPSLATIHLGGNLRSSNVEAFLALLQAGFPVIVEQTDTSVLLKRAPRH
jgi:hypothetical protein